MVVIYVYRITVFLCIVVTFYGQLIGEYQYNTKSKKDGDNNSVDNDCN